MGMSAGWETLRDQMTDLHFLFVIIKDTAT